MKPRRPFIWRYAALSASVLVLCAGCDWIGLSGSGRDDEPVVVHATEPFELAEGQSAVIEDYGLSITLVEVEDSRCPIGVMCVWAGEVRTSFRLQHEKVNYPLAINGLVDGEPREKGISHQVGSFDVELLAVAPYPSIDRDRPPVLTATLVVRIKE